MSDRAKLFPDRVVEGSWQVERIVQDGAIEIATFDGPTAREGFYGADATDKGQDPMTLGRFVIGVVVVGSLLWAMAFSVLYLGWPIRL